MSVPEQNGPPSPPAMPAAAPVGTISERPHPLSPVVKGWIAIAAVLFFGLQELPSHDLSMIGRVWWLIAVVIGLAFVVPLVLGYFSWRYTRFLIDDEQVRIEHNFISHRSERIAFTKIQSVDVVQPLVARLFGLAALRIDVGASGSAKSIEFLARDRAYQLRDYLITRAQGTRTTVIESAQRPVGDILADRSVADRVVVRVPTGRLAASIVISNGTLVFLVAATILVSVAALTGTLNAVFSTVFLVPWLIAAGTMLLNRIRNEYNFTLSTTADGGLRTASGLTSLVSQTVPRDRVQAVDISQPLVWRAFGWYRVRLDVLGLGMPSGDEGGVPANLLLPVGPRPEVDAVLAALWPALDLPAIAMRPIPQRARWLRWFDAHTYRWGFNDHVLVASGFLLNPRTSIVPHAKVQSVRLRQGPLQRRLRLASVQAHTTPGPVDVVCRHLDAPDARRLAMSELDRMRAARQRPPLHTLPPAHLPPQQWAPPAQSAPPAPPAPPAQWTPPSTGPAGGPLLAPRPWQERPRSSS